MDMHINDINKDCKGFQIHKIRFCSQGTSIKAFHLESVLISDIQGGNEGVLQQKRVHQKLVHLDWRIESKQISQRN